MPRPAVLTQAVVVVLLEIYLGLLVTGSRATLEGILYIMKRFPKTLWAIINGVFTEFEMYTQFTPFTRISRMTYGGTGYLLDIVRNGVPFMQLGGAQEAF